MKGSFRQLRLFLSLLVVLLVSFAIVAQQAEIERQPSRFDLTVGGGHDDEGTDESGAEGPCYSSDSVRFADCGNGTVTDQVTALTWLADATCLPLAYYAEANAIAATLGEGTYTDCGLTDGSSPGDWRLPSVDEWEALVEQAQANGCAWPDVLLPDTVGLGCATEGDPFSNLPTFPIYWSSTTVANAPGSAWGVSIQSFSPVAISGWGKLPGDDPDEDESPALRVWPVRD